MRMLTLPRRRIIKRRSDFQRVYRSGRSYANRYFVLYVFPAETVRGRVGFAAGKKLGCAVTRNRVKRLLRAASRLASSRARRRTFASFMGPIMGSVRSMGNLLQGKRGPELEDNSASIGAVLSRIHFADVPALLPLCPDVF